MKIIVLAIALMSAPTFAYAEYVIYDFTGTGYFCPLDAGGTPHCTDGISYTGEVRINVLSAVPGFFYAPPTFAYGINNWVESDFIIRWDDNTFNPERLPDPSSQPLQASRYSASITNDDPACDCDRINNSEYYEGSDPRNHSAASLNRRTTDMSWLSDLSFDLTLGLAPVVSGGNPINNVNEIGFNYHPPGQGGGFIGNIQLTSLTPRVPSVIMEAETMFLSYGYSVEPGEGQIFIADTVNNPQGYAHLSFPGGPGTYRIEVQLVNGGTGISDVEFYLNGERLGLLYFDYSTENLNLVFSNVTMLGGDDIILAGWAEGDGGARVDKILFTLQ